MMGKYPPSYLFPHMSICATYDQSRAFHGSRNTHTVGEEGVAKDLRQRSIIVAPLAARPQTVC